eukprot:Gregarina_sp_Poly_1__3951@NODE_218_length_11257_cov_139_614120_g192_i0_p3_GENE_NODE_218_length_11257_cov_139_614120_g192_i0NODE_218_length_11257_cov_139_614120_g192_i0_p3_ORF_typecomplete_len550_score130_60HOOK/PF05622_12/2_7HOOK/PF05622_12/0_00019Myosin_tail_1/PF01576_19/2_2e03Myosin_tail_1/PF01576_19/0_82Myosin_tail_1/PF01576_19/0_00011MAD/PF05557_13/0_00081MAD/PF05557_13/4_2APG6_N/PF17675_1/0_055APG6_N/PF17675_1/1_6e02APG6_N/PF17675_1/2_5e03APG6_N/PF17675_1/0_0066APG6_N/PF17675_1/3APG6_N/PF17
MNVQSAQTAPPSRQLSFMISVFRWFSQGVDRDSESPSTTDLATPEKDEDIKAMKVRKDCLQASHTELMKKISEAEEELSAMENNIKQVTDSLATLKQEEELTTQNLAEMRENERKLRANVERLSEAARAHMEMENAQESRLLELQCQVCEEETRLRYLSETISVEEERREDLHNCNLGLEEEKQALECKVEEFTQNLTEKQEELERVEQEAIDSEDRLAAVKHSLIVEETAATTLRSTVEALKEKKAELMGAIEVTMAANNECQVNLGRAKAELESLNATKEEAERETRTIRASLKALEEQIRKVEQDLTRVTTERNEMKQQVNAEIRQGEQERFISRTAREAEEKRMSELKAEASRLQQAIAELRSKQKEAEENIREKHAKLAETETQLAGAMSSRATEEEVLNRATGNRISAEKKLIEIEQCTQGLEAKVIELELRRERAKKDWTDKQRRVENLAAILDDMEAEVRHRKAAMAALSMRDRQWQEQLSFGNHLWRSQMAVRATARLSDTGLCTLPEETLDFSLTPRATRPASSPGPSSGVETQTTAAE